jgi:hypothetical protein
MDKPMFKVPGLTVRAGRIFALLDDCKIPIWDAGDCVSQVGPEVLMATVAFLVQIDIWW